MRKFGTLLLVALLATACNAQEGKNKELSENDKGKKDVESPEGTWKVDKEFDENGNLVRYDSIYSWSSGADLAHLGNLDRDSLLESFQARIHKNFSGIDPAQFQDFFQDDSLFTKRFIDDDFFNSAFGRDFMDIDSLRQRLEAKQRAFIDRYESGSPQDDEDLREDSPPQ